VGIVVQTTLCVLGLTRQVGVLREISKLPGAIHRLTVTLQTLAEAQRDHGPAEDRLEELERSRAMWEATVEGELLRALNKYKAAAAAEQRERKLSEKLDIFDEQGAEEQAGIPPEYALAGEAEEVQPVRMDVAPLNSKDLARRLKFL